MAASADDDDCVLSVAVTSVAAAIRYGAARLLHIADNPRLEARLLLAHALGLTPTELLRDTGRLIETAAYERLLVRREGREPVALILGHREFWSMEFQVSSATLIPRADSETLIEAALAVFGRSSSAKLPVSTAPDVVPRRILDLGTGTGCLLLALLHEFPAAFGIGVDISEAATTLARNNATQLGLIDRSAFFCGDWTNALIGEFDLVVSNPPYIAASDIAGLMPEVAHYEPRRALEGGADGYTAYRDILPCLQAVLAAEGVVILEVGAGQAAEVSAMAAACGFEGIVRLDLAGVPRAVVLSRRV